MSQQDKIVNVNKKTQDNKQISKLNNIMQNKFFFLGIIYKYICLKISKIYSSRDDFSAIVRTSVHPVSFIFETTTKMTPQGQCLIIYCI